MQAITNEFYLFNYLKYRQLSNLAINKSTVNNIKARYKF